MTTRSPCAVGMVLTRTSMSLPAIFRRMRPSCGRRFSAMFKPDMIFTRAITEDCACLGASTFLYSRPSMRLRTTTERS